MIYKMTDVKRLAGELLINDFKENSGLAFTNTSYGEAGTVLGSICGTNRKNKTEKTIIYTLLRKSWDDTEYNLIKIIRMCESEIQDKAGNTIREYKNEKVTQPIKTFYALSDGYCEEVFTTDKDVADEARKKHFARYDFRPAKKTEPKNRVLMPGTALYDKMLAYICNNAKVIKYGSPIEVNTYINMKDVYNYTTHKYEQKKEVSVYLTYTYRGKSHCICKSNTIC